MVNSPAHRHLLPLQREEIEDEKEELKRKKQAKVVEEEETEEALNSSPDMAQSGSAEMGEESGEEAEESHEDEEDEEDDDADEHEIRAQLHHLLNEETAPPPPRMAQSFSAHANLAMARRRPMAGNAFSRRRLTANAEEEADQEEADHKQKLEEEDENDAEEEDEEEAEDSDEEFFTAHAQLLPLRKSKSAFAGFLQSSSASVAQSTKPFACPVIVKQLDGPRRKLTTAKGEDDEEMNDEEEDGKGMEDNGIAELIDLRRGDVLKFRIAEPNNSNKNKKPDVYHDASSSSSSLSSLCPNGRTASCWSAPACPGEAAEFASDDEEGEVEEELSDDENDEGEKIGGKARKGRLGWSRKESSWSAPSQVKWEDQVGVEVEEDEEKHKDEQRQRTFEAVLDDWERRQRNVRIPEEAEYDEDEDGRRKMDEGEEVNAQRMGQDDNDDNEGNEESEEKLMEERLDNEEHVELEDEQIELDENKEQYLEVEEAIEKKEEIEENIDQADQAEDADADYLPSAEPTNIKCLEVAEQQQLEEEMATSEDEEDANEEEDGPTTSTGRGNGGKRMRVFVTPSSHHHHQQLGMPRLRRHFPSSRSDSQLLWHRRTGPATAPPPPAPFPLEEGKIMEEENGCALAKWTAVGELPHSRTYGGFLCGTGEEEEQEKGIEAEEERDIQRRLTELEDQMSQQLTSSQQKCVEEEIVEDEANKCANIEEVAEWTSEDENDEADQEEQEEEQHSPMIRPAQLVGQHCQLSVNSHNISSSDEIPMADDCPTPSRLPVMAGYLSLPLRGKNGGAIAKQTSTSAAHPHDNSLSSSSYYSEEEEEQSHRSNLASAIRRRGRPLVQRSSAARLSRRGSPPMAQLELLSESEISDLEQQIASGRLVKHESKQKTDELLDEEEEEKEEEEHDENDEESRQEASKENAEEDENQGQEEDEDVIEDEGKEADGREEEEEEADEMVGEERDENDEENVGEIDANQLNEEREANGGREDDEREENDEEAEATGNEGEEPEEHNGMKGENEDEMKNTSEEHGRDHRPQGQTEDVDGLPAHQAWGDDQQQQQQQMCASSSMPAISRRLQLPQLAANYWGSPDYVQADFWQSEYPIEGQEPGWEEAGTGMGTVEAFDCQRNMHRSLTVQSEFADAAGQFGRMPAQRRRPRRMLPLRPDQIDGSGSHGQGRRNRQSALSAPTAMTMPSAEEETQFCGSTEAVHRSLAASCSFDQPLQLDPAAVHRLSLSLYGKRRQLPKTPPSPTEPIAIGAAEVDQQIEAESALADPLDCIDIATASKEYLLSILHQTQQHRHQRMEEEQQQEILHGMERGVQETMNADDFSPPVLPSPSTVLQRPMIAHLPLRQQWHNQPHQPSADEQYTLSYGMDQSALRQARRGLSIDGSYYEDSLDGLNGNLAFYGARGGGGAWATGAAGDDDIYTPEEEGGEKRRVSAYNLPDGAKSSSGISSCCTTSSRSGGGDPAENGGIGEFPPTSSASKRPRNGQQRAVVARGPAADDPLAPTHRVQFPFMPRHGDELLLERGDALHVAEKFDDHWCFGLNLRTGQRGIFPEAHIVEIDLVDEICRSVLPDMNHQQRPERDTFYLTMLASIEVGHHKGNDVLVQAINKVCSMYQRKEEILVPQTVLMEVSFRGIHVIDKRKRDIFRCPTFDFFYSLQNISFCGAHPKELRYFGFITKHPLLPRFACHVFLSNESTQSIVEAIGRAFKRSYDEYMAFAHPTEDIFLE